MLHFATLALLAAMQSGYGLSMNNGDYISPFNRRPRKVYTLDEEEERSAKRMLRRAFNRQRDAYNAVGSIAKATGPWRHHFGYTHWATKPRTKSASLTRLLKKRR